MNEELKKWLVENFGTITNFALSLSVTVYGVFAWLNKRDLSGGPAFSRLAYRCWWASWLCWVFAWSVLLIAALTPGDEVPVNLRIATLIFDNLNSVFLILVYFIITRGNDFEMPKIRAAFMQISGSLALGCALLYMLSPLITLNFAYEVHRTWSLCLGVFSPMLIGWACNLRYNTLLILVIGFVYGFMQPLIYATELKPIESANVWSLSPAYKPIFAMALGGLKVLLAVAFMQVLVHGSTSSDSLVSSKTMLHFHFFRHWRKKVLGHALLLGIIYCCLLITLVSIYADKAASLATALGIVGGFLALLDWFWKLWDRGNKKE